MLDLLCLGEGKSEYGNARTKISNEIMTTAMWRSEVQSAQQLRALILCVRYDRLFMMRQEDALFQKIMTLEYVIRNILVMSSILLI